MKENFTKWVKFDDRELLSNDGFNLQGIYAIAFDPGGKLLGKDFKYDKKIVYFGRTCQETGFKNRLKFFSNVIYKGKGAHGGAKRFKPFYEKEKIKDWQKNLYISIWSFKGYEKNIYKQGSFDKENTQKVIKNLTIMGDICKAEYHCFSKFVSEHGRMPQFNNQKDSPKE